MVVIRISGARVAEGGDGQQHQDVTRLHLVQQRYLVDERGARLG